MGFHARRYAVLLCPLLVAAACSSGQQRTAHLLDSRLQTKLGADISSGAAALQPLPDGARVTLLDTSLFPNDVGALAGKNPDIRSSVVEALLDPSLMQIQLADTSNLPDEQRDARIQNVRQYIVANGLGSTLQPADTTLATNTAPAPGSAAATPGGLTLTISVHCPERNDGTGYGSGRSKPACY